MLFLYENSLTPRLVIRVYLWRVADSAILVGMHFFAMFALALIVLAAFGRYTVFEAVDAFMYLLIAVTVIPAVLLFFWLVPSAAALAGIIGLIVPAAMLQSWLNNRRRKREALIADRRPVAGV